MKARPLAAVCVLLLLFVPAACGGDKEDAAATPAGESESRRQTVLPAAQSEAGEAQAGEDSALEWSEQEADADAAAARLVEARLVPERLYRDSVPEVQVRTNPPDAGGTSMQVIFWINDRKAQESAALKLEADRLRKGDGVFADVILFAADREVDRSRTDLVLVENSDPVIEAVEFPEIKGPGEYFVVIKATDPDGDELAYDVEGVNLPAWLQVQGDGRVRLDPGESPPESVAFELVVRDNDGGEARRAVTLTFKSPETAAAEAAAEET